MTRIITQSLVEKLKNPNAKPTYFELAREITRLETEVDFKGMREFYSVYRKYIKSSWPKLSPTEVISRTRESLLTAARLAELVKKSGYEASGQLTFLALDGGNNIKGPIIRFYSKAIHQ